MKYLPIFLCALFFLGCENEQNTINCPEQDGNFDTDLKTTLRLTPRFTNFQISDSNSDLIVLNVYETTNSCLLLSNLLIFLQKKTGIQYLTPVVFNGGIERYGETIFFEKDDDATLGRFLLYEEEESFIEITELTEETIIGSLTATYVYEENEFPGAIRYIQLPDTLRFKNVAFTAQLFDNR